MLNKENILRAVTTEDIKTGLIFELISVSGNVDVHSLHPLGEVSLTQEECELQLAPHVSTLTTSQTLKKELRKWRILKRRSEASSDKENQHQFLKVRKVDDNIISLC